MTQRVLLVVACAFLLMGAGQLFAHHSFSATYDADNRIELEGTVRALQWRNPHSFLSLDVTEADGSTTTWSCEWGSVNQLQTLNITRTTFRPGERVKVAGPRARDLSSSRMLLTSVLRPSDGFKWEGEVD